uniref:Uncharacterized protein n=1 Tax=Timema poppense TaxID=170557 RepID=A0A7R9CN02_TIMPO|nr:unnamed protein product [Timema poppensis]
MHILQFCLVVIRLEQNWGNRVGSVECLQFVQWDVHSVFVQQDVLRVFVKQDVHSMFVQQDVHRVFVPQDVHSRMFTECLFVQQDVLRVFVKQDVHRMFVCSAGCSHSTAQAKEAKANKKGPMEVRNSCCVYEKPRVFGESSSESEDEECENCHGHVERRSNSQTPPGDTASGSANNVGPPGVFDTPGTFHRWLSRRPLDLIVPRVGKSSNGSEHPPIHHLARHPIGDFALPTSSLNHHLSDYVSEGLVLPSDDITPIIDFPAGIPALPASSAAHAATVIQGVPSLS